MQATGTSLQRFCLLLAPTSMLHFMISTHIALHVGF